MLVKSVMTREVVTVNSCASLEQALWLMKEKRVYKLPVVNQDQVVGLLVQHDIERAVRSPHLVLNSPVEWVMTRKPKTIAADAPLAAAAYLMYSHDISCLPVVQLDQLVGILCASDLLKVLAGLLADP